MVRGVRAGNRYLVRSASMEPCLFRHGKVTDADRRIVKVEQLQWSHVFSDMVRELRDRLSNILERASMEPCLFRHGKAGAEKRGVGAEDASMEPCLFRHGKTENKIPRRGPRTGASMEPCLFRHGKSQWCDEGGILRCRLQWSHVFSDMVSERNPRKNDKAVKASMEPCLFRHGKTSAV